MDKIGINKPARKKSFAASAVLFITACQQAWTILKQNRSYCVQSWVRLRKGRLGRITAGHGEGRDATCRRRASRPVAPGLQRFRDQWEQARKHHFVSDFGPRSGNDD